MLKRLNILIILLLLFISGNSYPGINEWVQLPVPPIFKKTDGTNEYVEIRCYDSLNCMAFLQYNGECGNRIIRTTDGGMSWDDVYFDTCQFGNQSIPFPCPIKAIAYPGPNLFIAVGDSGFVLRTTDKGVTWDSYNFDKYRGYYYLSMMNEIDGIGWGGVYHLKNEYYKTNDGGKSWVVLNSDNYFDGKYLDAIQTINKDLFYALYWEPSDKSMRLLRVHGNWESWDTTFLCYNYRLHYMSFINEKVGYIGGELPIGVKSFKKWILKTDDGGYTWKTILDSNMYAGPLFDLKFYDENFGFAASAWWTIVRTSNGGTSWETDRMTDDTTELKHALIFTSLQVPCQTNAYCLGDRQYIWKYTRDWTSSPDTPPAEHSGIYLYPNPASDYIEINLGRWTPSVRWSPSDLTIYNSLGEIVLAPLAFGEEPGVRLDISHLPIGLYLISINNGKETLTGSFIVMR